VLYKYFAPLALRQPEGEESSAGLQQRRTIGIGSGVQCAEEIEKPASEQNFHGIASRLTAAPVRRSSLVRAGLLNDWTLPSLNPMLP
jgi:hypothetical protein